MGADRTAGEFKSNQIAFFAPGRPKFSRRSNTRSARLGEQWKQPREREPEQLTSVTPVATPEVRFLFDPPQPLKTSEPEKVRCPFDDSRLEINGRAKLASNRYRQAIMIPQQPFLRFLSAEKNG